MKKIIYSLSFLILSAALPVAAFAADMHCFYKSSGKNIITVCKKDGNLYYDSLADVLSEFVSNSGIRSGEAYNFSTVQDKNGDNPKVADYISKNLFAKLSHAGIKADKDVNSKISAAFEITGSNMEILFNVPDKNYSEKLILLNAEAIKEDAEIYAIAQHVKCTELIECPEKKCEECPNGPTFLNRLSDFFNAHEFAIFLCIFVAGLLLVSLSKWSNFGVALAFLASIGIIIYIWAVFSNKCLVLGIYLIILALLWNLIFKPKYPSNKEQIWTIILLLITGFTLICWPMWYLSLIILILFYMLRKLGILRRL
ncbi:MAG: hypothetical protein J5706_06485 [Elusimicrobiales bacterium]|nr:hypothetical protein [Elusimicrobiales bacterium]